MLFGCWFIACVFRRMRVVSKEIYLLIYWGSSCHWVEAGVWLWVEWSIVVNNAGESISRMRWWRLLLRLGRMFIPLMPLAFFLLSKPSFMSPLPSTMLWDELLVCMVYELSQLSSVPGLPSSLSAQVVIGIVAKAIMLDCMCRIRFAFIPSLNTRRATYSPSLYIYRLAQLSWIISSILFTCSVTATCRGNFHTSPFLCLCMRWW
jgi:hypothetical protein